MCRFAGLLCWALLFPWAVQAHEFWIEAEALILMEDDAFEPVLMIGDHPDGEAYAFQPQAYAQAIWSGPGAQQDLSRVPLSAPPPTFRPYGPGTHTLAVSTFPQKLEHASEADFMTFLREIGQERIVLSGSSTLPENGEVHETYRRFSKTIVRVGPDGVGDQRVGLAREWVRQGDTFTLFESDRPSGNQRARVSCTTGNLQAAVTVEILQTSPTGTITLDLPAGGRCLINSVFLTHDPQSGLWHSEWVSFYFQEPSG